MLDYTKTFFLFCLAIVGAAVLMFEEYASLVPRTTRLGKQTESMSTISMNYTRQLEWRISSSYVHRTFKQGNMIRRAPDNSEHKRPVRQNRNSKRRNTIRSPKHLSSAPSSSATGAKPEEVPRRCEPHQHVGYIKTHKTGSTTLEYIFNRFGFLHNSSFIFNTGDPMGHFEIMDLRGRMGDLAMKHFLPPIGVQAGDYANYKNYDTFAIHVRFFRDVFERFTASDMRYVTSVRDPADQWESAFNQFHFRSAIVKVAGPARTIVVNNTSKMPFSENNSTLEAINEFLRAPEMYHRVMKSGSAVYYHFAHNDQMYDLGTYLDGEQIKNEMLVNRTIDRLVRDLDFVIVNEYFDESLVVMKKELCWDFKDILYIPKNMRAKKEAMPEETRAKIRAWNRADTLLHIRFNQTLWEKIQAYGPAFKQDLDHFRQLLSEVKKNCSVEGRPEPHGFNYEVVSTKIKPNSSYFCRLLAEDIFQSFGRVFQRQKSQSRLKTM